MDANELLANFSRILVPAETLDDAIAARDALNLRSTGMMGWDPESDRPTLSEVDEEQAEAWAVAAERLVNRVREYEVVRSDTRSDVDQETPEDARPWLAPVEMAKSRKVPLFSDDSVLRAAARSDGVAAFGTFDLLTVLVDKGELEEEDYKGALKDLRRNRAADLPLDVEQTLEIAAENEWQAGPAALVLARPAIWQEPVSALSLYNEFISKVLAHNEMLLPDWCAAAILGFARGWPSVVIAQRAGRLLAHTVLMSIVVSNELETKLFAPLLAAARQASQSLSGDDPLPSGVESLKEMLEGTVGVANASQVFAKLADGLDSADRYTALEVFLKPSST